MSSPEMVAANAAGLATTAAQEAALQSPEAVAARTDSADAYADLSSSEASDLAAETFTPLSDPTWEPPEIPDGWELVRYEGKTGMLIAPEGTGDLLSNPPDTLPVDTDLSNLGINGRVIESTMPIRAQDGSEGLQPVNPSLDDKGDYVEPANAVVEAQIPDDLSDGIDLPELDVSLKPEGANAASDAEQIGSDKLFYADVATDTDFLATPTPTGVETFLQLRSADSPEQQSLHVDVPEGGSLSSTDDGGAVIEDDEGPVASVLPPSATDADGTPVPVEMSVDGSSLSLEIDHQGGDFHYPILVDPVTQSYDWLSWTGDACPGAGTSGNVGWWFETTAPTKFAAAPCQAGNYGMGLINASIINKTYAANDYSQWIWKAPTKTSIQAVTFGSTHGVSASSCANYGIYKTQSPAGWQASNLADPDRCSSWGSNASKTYSIGSTGVEQNLAVMGLSFPTAGKRTTQATDYAGNFAATLYDTHLPWFTSTKPDDSAWVDDTEGTGTHTYTQTIAATDEGLGMKYFWFLTPQVSDPSQWAVQPEVRPCSVTGAGSCYAPPSWSKDFSYHLPEGENRVIAIAFDQGASMNQTSYEWKQRIDRSAPAVSPASGSLIQNASHLANNATYQLQVAAADGSPETASTLRSGVAGISVFLDDRSSPIAEENEPCNQPGSTCPSSTTATLPIDTDDIGYGNHELTVKVTDGVGHTAQPTAGPIPIHVGPSSAGPSIDLDAFNPNEGDTLVDIPSHVWAQDNSPKTLTKVALSIDGAPYDSINLPSADEDEWTNADPNCLQSSCKFTWEADTADWIPGEHTLMATVTDSTGAEASATAEISTGLNSIVDDGPDGLSTSTSASLAFHANGATSYQCRIDGGSWANCSSPRTYNGLSEGNHIFEVRGTMGSVAEETPAAREWIVDHSAPVTSLSGGPSGETSSGSATFQFGSSQAGSTFECRWDYSAWSGCSSPASQSGIDDGSHSFVVRAVNSNGEADKSPEAAEWAVTGQSAEQDCSPTADEDTEEASSLIHNAFPSIIAPSQSGDVGGVELDPTLSLPSDQNPEAVSQDSLSDAIVDCDPLHGFSADTNWGDIQFKPTQMGNAASVAAIAHGDSVVYADVATHTSEVVRPTEQGVQAFNVLEAADSPNTFSWTVTMPGGVLAKQLDDGSIAVLADPTPVDPGNSEDDDDLTLTMADVAGVRDDGVLPIAAGLGSDYPDQMTVVDSSEIGEESVARSGSLSTIEDAPDVEAQASEAAADLSRSFSDTQSGNGDSQPTPAEIGAATAGGANPGIDLNTLGDEYLLGVLSPPVAIDSSGAALPTSIGVDGGDLTVSVDDSGAAVNYPVVVRHVAFNQCVHKPSPCGTFHQNMAAAYAYKWRTSPNWPRYPKFDGTNCTEFASEVLRAGGFSFMAKPGHTDEVRAWWGRGPRKRNNGLAIYWVRQKNTYTWSLTVWLYHHLLNTGRGKEISGKHQDYRRGDILFWKWADDTGREFDHASVVYSVDSRGVPYILQKDKDYDRPRTLKYFRNRAERHNGGIAKMAHIRPIHTHADF